MQMFDLTGKVAVVTGGNGGIGLGYAKGLAKAGAKVAIWGRNLRKNSDAVNELHGLGAEAASVACDVGSEDDVDRAFEQTLEQFGKVDSVFANAGLGTRNTRFVDMTLDEWKEIFRVNSEGLFLTLRAGARHMTERGEGGSLVATASVSSVMGMPRGEHYAATKAGAIAMVRALAVEFGKTGIRANAVVPGWIDTDMTNVALRSEGFTQRVLPRIPRRRWGLPSDFEAVAVYLASDASTYHTGDVLTIDGGYTVF
jgi:NAD(P)-dependent dehydrogenase (short-subunit alcohol dehydrogenase family)